MRISQGEATRVCRLLFGPVSFQNQEWSQPYMASPFAASGTISQGANEILGSHHITLYSFLYPRLLFFLVFIYTQTFPTFRRDGHLVWSLCWSTLQGAVLVWEVLAPQSTPIQRGYGYPGAERVGCLQHQARKPHSLVAPVLPDGVKAHPVPSGP